jgi:hypothetical protein
MEEGLEMQPQPFVMLGINDDAYNAVVLVTSQFSRPLIIWWLNREQLPSIPYAFDCLVIVTSITFQLLLVNKYYKLF